LKGKEKFKDTLGVIRGRETMTDNTMIYKTLHKHYRSSNTNVSNNRS